MTLQDVLEAARLDILEAFATWDHSVDSKVFSKVLFISRRAEHICAAQGRSDALLVQTSALDDLEAKAPRFHAALQEYLLGGNPLLQRKFQQLEADHKKVREAGAVVAAAHDKLVNRELALSSGEAAMRQLAVSNLAETLVRRDTEAEELEGETVIEAPVVPPLPPLPRDPERVADDEIDAETAAHKEPPFSESVEKPRRAW